MASFTLGLDLAIVRDNSAAVLVERFIRHAGSLRPNGEPQTVPHSRVQGIWRFERGTPFTTVLEEVGRILQASALRRSCLLVYDKTGLGNAVAESVDRAYVAGKLGAWRPRGLTQTAGHDSKGWNVPKRDLVSEVAVAPPGAEARDFPQAATRRQAGSGARGLPGPDHGGRERSVRGGDRVST